VIRAHLALGSNIGRPASKIARATSALSQTKGISLRQVSQTFPSRPVGPVDQPDFLNAAAIIDTSLSPMGLLVALKRIETALGRRPGLWWGPRPIDLDILSYGGLRHKDHWLTLPHPHLHRRRFVLEPLCDIAPEWVPPVEPRRTVSAWLRLSKSP